MQKLLSSGVAVLSLFVMAGQAIADEPPPKKERAVRAAPARAAPQRAAPQQQASNWSGGQAGGSNGASSANNNFVEPGAYNFSNCPFNCVETPFAFSGNRASYIVGAFLGYRWQMGNIVVGVEGDVYWKGGETSKVQNTPPFTPPLFVDYETFTGSLKQGTDGSVRARFGVLVTPWTLLYATGGLAIGNVSGSFSYSNCAQFGTSPSVPSPFCVSGASTWSDTRVGGTVGVGAETQVIDRVKARIEYRYTDFGKFSKDVPLTNNCFPGDCGTNAHIDLRAYNHRVTVGLGFDLWQ